MTFWAGRIGGGELAADVWEFLRADDAELLSYDWTATLQHAQRLHAAGILDEDELTEVSAGLAELQEVKPEDEDVHSAIERGLGEVGRKIHAGRSRNDQVAAALRLYVQDAAREADSAVRSFCAVVLDRAEADAETPMPGYTHLQRAIPVSVGHHLLAWVEMLERDLVRFAFAEASARPSPLGSGALAGSTLPLPPPDGEQLRNSLDAVADRDFALDYLYACTVLFTHLSRVGEELVLWSTSEFGFVKLPESAATGSSMMPQKLNPDVAELVRGKAGTMIGRLTGLLAVVKGLPLAYDRDLQEDKTPVFAARRDVKLALAALDGARGRAGVRPDEARGRSSRPAAARDGQGRGPGPGRCPVPRRPRAGRRRGAGGHVRAAGRFNRRASRQARRTCPQRSRLPGRASRLSGSEPLSPHDLAQPPFSSQAAALGTDAFRASGSEPQTWTGSVRTRVSLLVPRAPEEPADHAEHDQRHDDREDEDHLERPLVVVEDQTSAWMRCVDSRSAPPARPARTARISARIESAVSSGVCPPRSSPAGPWMRSSASSDTPASSRRSRRFSWVRREPIAPT